MRRTVSVAWVGREESAAFGKPEVTPQAGWAWAWGTAVAVPKVVNRVSSRASTVVAVREV